MRRDIHEQQWSWPLKGHSTENFTEHLHCAKYSGMLRSWSPHTFERKVEFPFQIRKCRFREFTNLEKELKCESPLISKAWPLPRLPQGAPSFYREKQGPFDWLQVTRWTRTQRRALGPILPFFSLTEPVLLHAKWSPGLRLLFMSRRASSVQTLASPSFMALVRFIEV